MRNENRYKYSSIQELCPELFPDAGLFFKNHFFLLILSLGFFFCNVNAQKKNISNLEEFYMLADSSVFTASSKIPADNRIVVLSCVLQGDYAVFENKIVESLYKKNLKVIRYTGKDVDKSSDYNNSCRILYQIDRAEVKYSDTFREGWFGALKVKRNITLGGSISVNGNSGYIYSGDFLLSKQDTVVYEDLSELENVQFQFTLAEHPDEPLFENLFEPVIAVSTAAAAVYLFFTVRSK